MDSSAEKRQSALDYFKASSGLFRGKNIIEY